MLSYSVLTPSEAYGVLLCVAVEPCLICQNICLNSLFKIKLVVEVFSPIYVTYHFWSSHTECAEIWDCTLRSKKSWMNRESTPSWGCIEKRFRNWPVILLFKSVQNTLWCNPMRGYSTYPFNFFLESVLCFCSWTVIHVVLYLFKPE